MAGFATRASFAGHTPPTASFYRDFSRSLTKRRPGTCWRACWRWSWARVGSGSAWAEISRSASLRWRVFYAGRLAQFVRSQHQMRHIPKTGFIVRNRASEGAERSHQDLNAIEIGTHMVEYAMQLEPYSIYSRLRSH